MMMRRTTLRTAVCIGLLVALAGCPSVRTSTPMTSAGAQKGMHLLRDLPKDALPDKSTPVPHAQFVLLPAAGSVATAVSMLMPIPFVTEALASGMNSAAAREYEAKIAGIHPFQVVRASLQQSSVLKLDDRGVTTYPFVFAQECIDDRYRFALVAHVVDGEWVGRYVVHLPLAMPVADFAKASPETLRTLETALADAAVTLRQLLERAATGNLKSSGVMAEVGSLNLVGVRAGGLVSPMLVRQKDAEVIEEGPDHVLVRMPGDMKQEAAVGGLFFGVHHLRRDQLHTFEKRSAK